MQLKIWADTCAVVLFLAFYGNVEDLMSFAILPLTETIGIRLLLALFA